MHTHPTTKKHSKRGANHRRWMAILSEKIRLTRGNKPCPK